MNKITINNQREPSSFRDPAGFLFDEKGVLYRQINPVGIPDYQLLSDSGLYQQLVEESLLIPHEEITQPHQDQTTSQIIRPERIEFISYPYEWCFSQLKHAALLTLRIEKKALSKGMTLKDCSAYNVQFRRGKPIFVDTLSFERYAEGKPWDAYRQFCQHFLAPLALMAYTDVRLNCLSRDYIDGIPLDLASQLLGRRSYLNFGLFVHIHLHARSQNRFAGKDLDPSKLSGKVSLTQLLGLIESLESTILRLKWSATPKGWAEYESFHNYPEPAMEHKKDLVGKYLEQIRPQIVWDLGANTGVFSRIASRKGAFTVAFDMDPGAVERNYSQMQSDKEDKLLPLVVDLSNPSPALGWAGEERKSLLQRGPSDATLALALLHHLAIGNNLPFTHLARYLQRVSRWLIIEFVPKADVQAARLLRVRKDIFQDYHQEGFERDFSAWFDLVAREDIRETSRSLYLFKNKTSQD